MTSIRKSKKAIKVGAANMALNGRIVKLCLPEVEKVSDSSHRKVLKKIVKGTEVNIGLKGKGLEKLGNTYYKAKVATIKKLDKKTDLQIVAKASKTR